MSTLDEKSMQVLEDEIPKLAEGATKQAYLQALASGSSVVKVQQGQLVEVSADGSFRVIKNITPTKKVKVGSTLRLQA